MSLRRRVTHCGSIALHQVHEDIALHAEQVLKVIAAGGSRGVETVRKRSGADAQSAQDKGTHAKSPACATLSNSPFLANSVMSFMQMSLTSPKSAKIAKRSG